MADGTLDSLCRSFTDRLEDRVKTNHNGEAFFPRGTAEEVLRNSQKKLKSLLSILLDIPVADTVRLSELVTETLSNILAILLSLKEGLEILQQFSQLLPSETNLPGSPLSITDDELPISRETARRIFPLCGNEFYEKQFHFCPVVLNENERVIYNNDKGRCPLPYLQQESIASGAFGKVWKVNIAGNHVRSDRGRLSNSTPVALARKDFKITRLEGFEIEEKTLRNIMNQPTRHDSITLAKAILQHEDVFSIFFPLATCDLWHYLSKSSESRKPSDMPEKRTIFHRGVTLAGALAFLHGEFKNTETFQDLSCYHLDLKPHNILVFDAGTPLEKWKITDFGISRVKSRKMNGGKRINLQLDTPWIKKTSSLRPIDAELTSRPRGEGTYLPPEYADERGQVSWTSDIWSYGCILSLVLSFIDGGAGSVLSFSQKRAEANPDGDLFFVSRRGKPQPSPAVNEWFDKLKANSRVRGEIEHEIFCQTLDVLRKDSLSLDPKSRKSARAIEIKLGGITQIFDQPHRIARESTLSAVARHILPQSKIIKDMRNSMFSIDGELLGFYSPERIDVFQSDTLRRAKKRIEPDFGPFVNTRRSPWECFAINSSYICIVPKVVRGSHHFECHIFAISYDLQIKDDTGNITPTKIACHPEAGSIQSIAMSADGRFMAFVVTCPGSSNSDCKVYLFRTQTMMDSATSSDYSPRSSRSTSAFSSASSETTPLGCNVIVKSSKLGSIKHIFKFMFSRDSQTLVIVAQQPDERMLIKAWDTNSGKALAGFILPWQGLASSSEATFTACTMFDTVPCFVLLLQCRYLVVIKSWQKSYHCCTLNRYFVDILARDDGENSSLILLGGDSNTNIQQAYELPMTSFNLLRNGAPARIGNKEKFVYRKSTDSAVLTGYGSGDRELLISKNDGSFLAIKLPKGKELNHS
ncbi:hypothetical protein MW887_000191 [Aspergillus wentii]|nr:hypothetical protein MW887_000191 [Aspergillus wentii]